MNPLIYVSGPMSSDLLGCVRKSLPAFRWLRDMDCVPFMPQFSVVAEIVEPLPYETYLAYDFDVIRHCQGMLRLPGASPGADREMAFAEELGIPVWHWGNPISMASLTDYLAKCPV